VANTCSATPGDFGTAIGEGEGEGEGVTAGCGAPGGGTLVGNDGTSAAATS
jgi:hypothetical protein